MAASLSEPAARLLAENTQQARRDGRVYTFTVPSVRSYPFQWFWDSCFHAIAWSRLDGERAKEEVRALLANQDPDGFIPHVVFWDPAQIRRHPLHFHYLETHGRRPYLRAADRPLASAHMQPPVLAQAVERIVRASGDDAFRLETLPALEQYHRWLASERDHDRDGLVSIISQFESGLDYSPAYDSSVGAAPQNPVSVFWRARLPQVVNKLRCRYDLRRIFRHGYHQEDVLVNAVFAQGLEALARLAGDGTELSVWAEGQAGRTLDALVSKCYDARSGLFYNLVGNEEVQARVTTIISLMPLILPGLPARIADALVDHLTNPAEFWTPYPVPSVSRSEPAFVPTIRLRGVRLIWRGPTSLNTNWFLAHGLRAHGHDAVAATLAERSRELVARSGFNEFFNPLTGEAVGVARFGWATLAIDL